MAMFGKNNINSTAVAYDEDKKSGKADKKKGLLNMPISTNIQYKC